MRRTPAHCTSPTRLHARPSTAGVRTRPGRADLSSRNFQSGAPGIGARATELELPAVSGAPGDACQIKVVAQWSHIAPRVAADISGGHGPRVQLQDRGIRERAAAVQQREVGNSGASGRLLPGLQQRALVAKFRHWLTWRAVAGRRAGRRHTKRLSSASWRRLQWGSERVFNWRACHAALVCVLQRIHSSSGCSPARMPAAAAVAPPGQESP